MLSSRLFDSDSKNDYKRPCAEVIGIQQARAVQTTDKNKWRAGPTRQMAFGTHARKQADTAPQETRAGLDRNRYNQTDKCVESAISLQDGKRIQFRA
jgi:hypothetical protein